MKTWRSFIGLRRRETPLNAQVPETVICDECRHLVEAASAQRVTRTNGDPPFSFFCREHRKKYDEIGSLFGRRVFYSKMEVDEDGHPIHWRDT